ncbi:hypothetical protein [Microvirga flavescens]|uniref:hypothetical protein n=1 Tax=Microvirga flavescens TaxID=2249811 RepID=UPI000DD797C7|nr:hypothetical protein [Microvirga flavescens]
MKWLAALMSCAMLSTPVLAREITPAEERDSSYTASLPACEDPLVLYSVANRFSRKEARFWNSPLEIVQFEGVRQEAWRPWGLDYIPRRFCTGTVLISDGSRHRIDFSIRKDLDFIGVSWGTEACVEGFDRNYAYAPQCKQAQP